LGISAGKSRGEGVRRFAAKGQFAVLDEMTMPAKNGLRLNIPK